MINKCKFLIGFIVTALMPYIAMAQNVENAIENKFKHYTLNTLQEKVYLHTDKSSYLAGEIVWFSTYLLEASTNTTVDISKVAYIEILNSANTSVIQAKIQVKDGLGNGSLYLPSALPTGNYTLRAYTNWMKNFSPELYFHKQLQIINTLKEEAIKISKDEPAHYIQLFPEGGNLVSGLKSKVAFRAIDNTGRGISFRGVILNQKNDTIAKFKPSKFGIGTFSLIPQKDMSYRAIIVSASGRTFTADLPMISNSGSVMQLTKNAANYNLKLNTTELNEKHFKVFVHTGHKVGFNKAITTENGVGEISIPNTNLTDGVSHITVFDEFDQPVCERLVFKKPSKTLHLDADPLKTQVGRREKVSINLRSTDELDKPLTSAFSISVALADSLENANEDLPSFAWLTSELNGKIENPGYYLDSDDEEARDNLMLTHGWRRFKWEDIKNNQRAFKYKPEVTGHIITGRVIDSLSNTPVKNKVAYLSVPGKRSQFYNAISNALGDVNFYTENFTGFNEVIVQANPKTDSLLKIELNSPFSRLYSSTKPGQFVYSKEKLESLRQRNVAMQITNAFAGDSLKREYLPTVSSLPFYSRPSFSYKLDDYVRFTTMEDVLREYVKEIFVEAKKKSYQVKIYDPEKKELYKNSPLILVDGVPIFNDNELIEFDPLKVQRLDVVNTQYRYGPSEFDGIASFITSKGDITDLKINSHATVLDYEGLQLRREFYSPMYDGDNAKSTVPDLRNTLYWLPSQTTDQKGLSSISFYTSDQPGKYKVLIQGLSDNSRLGSKVFTIEVR
jgi:hypothetical protein